MSIVAELKLFYFGSGSTFFFIGLQLHMQPYVGRNQCDFNRYCTVNSIKQIISAPDPQNNLVPCSIAMCPVLLISPDIMASFCFPFFQLRILFLDSNVDQDPRGFPQCQDPDPEKLKHGKSEQEIYIMSQKSEKLILKVKQEINWYRYMLKILNILVLLWKVFLRLVSINFCWYFFLVN